MQTAATPFYLDWTFWAFVTSAIAIGLSQAPPIRQWFRGPKLLVETPKQMRITHALGYAIAGVVLSIRNIGGRPVRIQSLAFKFRRDGKPVLEIPITEFHPNPTNNQTLMIMPFTLAAGAELTRSVNGYLELPRDGNRQLSRLLSAVRRDIGTKVREKQKQKQTPSSDELVELDPAVLAEATDLYTKNFSWVAGEYDVEIQVVTEEACEVKQPKKDFTIWESDEADLRALVDEYKHGFGIGIPSEKHAGVFVNLRTT